MIWTEQNRQLYYGEDRHLSATIYRDRKCWKWRMGPSRMIYERGVVNDQGRPRAYSLAEAKREVEAACDKHF
jgi:hypothetical protein